jgi:threonine dehydratase
MRVVVAPPAAGPPRPERAAIESVRAMGERFPGAKLREVPLVRAEELDRGADPTGATRVWLALESLQVAGSFKARGALVALDRRRGGRVVAASAGNHGAAVSYACSVLGVSATVFVSRSAPMAKRRKIERWGARLVVVDSDHYDDAEARAKEAAAREGVAFVSPYDDVDVILGNGVSLGLEIVRALGRVPERVIAPFGGGGLATGLAWAMDHEAGGATRNVWGAQSEASCAMAMSLERGVAVERLETGGTTLADGLEGGIAADAFARAREAVAGVAVVTEAGIASAMVRAYRDLGLVLEGASATALVPVLEGLPEPVAPGPAVAAGGGDGAGDLVVVLTGRNVDSERLDMLCRHE